VVRWRMDAYTFICTPAEIPRRHPASSPSDVTIENIFCIGFGLNSIYRAVASRGGRRSGDYETSAFSIAS
jgi:hypothetical protein